MNGHPGLDWGSLMSAMPQIRFKRFLNSGTGRTGKTLGELPVAIYFTNAVELQFSVDPGIGAIYRNLRPRQWSGPESIWIKTGNPLQSQWTLRHRSQGSGADDPERENIVVAPDVVAYYDSPGPSVFSFVSPRVSRVHVVQNFTGWVEADRVREGRSERTCEAVSWHSVISLVDQNWSDTQATQQWVRISGNGSGVGWAPIEPPPAV